MHHSLFLIPTQISHFFFFFSLVLPAAIRADRCPWPSVASCGSSTCTKDL